MFALKDGLQRYEACYGSSSAARSSMLSQEPDVLVFDASLVKKEPGIDDDDDDVDDPVAMSALSSSGMYAGATDEAIRLTTGSD